MGLFRKILQTGIIPIEKISNYLYPIKKKGKYPPIFILGSPRSGATLLIQSMIQYFDIAYLTNFTNYFYKVPLTGLWLEQHLLIKIPLMNFNSRFGDTSGSLGPNEAADFWNQWFPSGKNIYVGEGEISMDILRDMRQKIRGFIRLSKKPFLFKNLYCFITQYDLIKFNLPIIQIRIFLL